MANKSTKLSANQILKWADVHHKRTKKWPTATAGNVRGAAGETWSAINAALRTGSRGLTGRTSLPQLLDKKRGVRNRLAQPTLPAKKILAWADAHKRKTKKWPNRESGNVIGMPGENWSAIHEALRHGRRGHKAGGSLAKFLSKNRDRPYRKKGGPLAVKQILTWAKSHHKRTGYWPTKDTGKITGTANERWGTIDAALKGGFRKMRGDSSLAKLLDKHFD